MEGPNRVTQDAKADKNLEQCRTSSSSYEVEKMQGAITELSGLRLEPKASILVCRNILTKLFSANRIKKPAIRGLVTSERF